MLIFLIWVKNSLRNFWIIFRCRFQTTPGLMNSVTIDVNYTKPKLVVKIVRQCFFSKPIQAFAATPPMGWWSVFDPHRKCQATNNINNFILRHYFLNTLVNLWTNIKKYLCPHVLFFSKNIRLFPKRYY